MSFQNITTGPKASIAFTPALIGNKHSVPGYSASLSFHPGRVDGCNERSLAFDIIHPATGEKVGELRFTNMSNRGCLVHVRLFDREMSGALNLTARRKGSIETVSIGCDAAAVSFCSKVKHVWFKACMDSADENVPRRFLRRSPSRIRFTIEFPAKYGELKTAA